MKRKKLAKVLAKVLRAAVDKVQPWPNGLIVVDQQSRRFLNEVINQLNKSASGAATASEGVPLETEVARWQEKKSRKKQSSASKKSTA